MTACPRGRTFFELRGLASNTDGRILDASEGAMTIIYSDTGIVVETVRERFIGLAATSSSGQVDIVQGEASQLFAVEIPGD